MAAERLGTGTSPEEVETRLQQAEKLLAGASEAQRAPLDAQIKEIRAKLAAAEGAKYERSIRLAREAFDKAKKLRADKLEPYVEDKLQEAEKFLQDVPNAQKAPVVAEIKSFRGGGAVKSPAAIALEQRLTGIIDQGERDLERSPEYAAEDIKRAAAILSSEEGKQLDAATIGNLQTRIAAAQAKLGSNRIKDALARGADPLSELETKLATDPFKGLDQIQANKMNNDLQYLVKRVHAAIDDQPKDSADVKAMNARLASIEAKLDAGVALWIKTQDIARLTGSWQFNLQAVAGWEEETPAPSSPGSVKPWLMSKTGTAIRYSILWLDDKETKELAERYKDDPTVKATVAAAEKTRDSAALKLNAAFNQSLDEAEKMPLPQRSYDLSLPAAMSHEAAQWFASTKYKDDNVGRADRLDQKWKAELAAIEKEAAEQLKTMTAEADAAWPRIAASIKAQEGFKPADAAALKGKIVRLKGVRNRSGWDFDGKYDFAMWVGDAVLAGSYEPYIAEAMNEASRRIRRSVDDHIDWEVFAVIGDPGKINRRVWTELIDQRTRDVIMKIESHEPMDCIRIRVIALHAGPVAVGVK
ncbi:MAG: hypothetical protein HY246_14650 [Proteobacteria bacterium]|nr:hypothetical protein [Pseudomonadota bacterium]